MLQRSHAERDSLTLTAQRLAAARVRLLFDSRHLSAAVTIVAALILCWLEWDFDPRPITLAWTACLIVTASGRLDLGRRYWRKQQSR